MSTVRPGEVCMACGERHPCDTYAWAGFAVRWCERCAAKFRATPADSAPAVRE